MFFCNLWSFFLMCILKRTRKALNCCLNFTCNTEQIIYIFSVLEGHSPPGHTRTSQWWPSSWDCSGSRCWGRPWWRARRGNFSWYSDCRIHPSGRWSSAWSAGHLERRNGSEWVHDWKITPSKTILDSLWTQDGDKRRRRGCDLHRARKACCEAVSTSTLLRMSLLMM